VAKWTLSQILGQGSVGLTAIVDNLLQSGMYDFEAMSLYLQERFPGLDRRTADAALSRTLLGLDAGDRLTAGFDLTRDEIPVNPDICDYGALGAECAYTAIVQVCVTDAHGNERWVTVVLHFATLAELNDLDVEIEDLVEEGDLLANTMADTLPLSGNELCGFNVTAVYRRT